MNIYFFSPLEQFQIIPIISLPVGFIDLSIINETVILFLMFVFGSLLFLSFGKLGDSSFTIVPNRWQIIIEEFYILNLGLVKCNIKTIDSQKYFPIIFFIFLFVLFTNVIGLIPYSFTLTSHFIITFSLSLSFFLGLNIICMKCHGIRMFSLFLPSGTTIYLALLLVPLEMISYFFKPISLSVRLFANMMAGHLLLKVIVGFSFSLLSAVGLYFLLNFIPLFILLPLFGLELFVSFIQAFVFSLLICIYINDSISLH
jgi:ATP synthase subunit 6